VVTFQSGAGDYLARLQVDGAAPQAQAAARRFSARDCSRLGDAVGLAIALALGAEAPSEPDGALSRVLASEPRGVPPPTPPQPAVAPRDQPAAAAPEQSSAPALTPLLAAALLVDSGSLPAAGLGLSVAAELRSARLALRVGGTLLGLR
jgi:hypothetical protein